jgi:rhodanese-related sulfurtransferase
MAETISAQELKKLDATEFTLLDVRRKADQEASPQGIPGAAWKDPEQIEVWSADLPRDKPVVIYCVRGGSVSTSVQAALKAQDFDVKFVEGGLVAWSGLAAAKEE